MTFGSKRILASLAAGVALYAAYIAFSLSQSAPDPGNLQAWARVMLVFIGIGVVLAVIIQVLFHIAAAIGIAAKERDCRGEKIDRIISSSMVEDERDKLISLKSAHIGYITAGFGAIAAIAALAIGASALLMLHILLGSFGAASLIEGVLSIVYYEKGVSNG